ncbi:hypothetical protein BST85_01830 [Aureitalea marina]|uniref:Secretion system C-terminal sorting domain-containing protein n=2 Tax=Aureitalea marina TaxID=930804 RepID=A0A2S7KMF9_9FLAO|nr:hypothetical protein BST85_01830 [Aureitalea marina]
MIGALLVGSIGFAQQSLTTSTSTNQNQIDTANRGGGGDACTFDTTSFSTFENGWGIAAAFIVADDFNTGANDVTIQETLIHVISGTAGAGEDLVSVDFFVYEDAGGLPGTEISAEFGLVPTSQVDAGDAFGRDVWAVTIDHADIELTGPNTTYWIGVLAVASGADGFWEFQTTDILDNPVAGSGDGGATWETLSSDGDTQSVYAITADCTVLGNPEAFLEQISIFPNPATDILNVRTPASVEINNAVIYDVLGKASSVQVVNGQINVSNLSRGVYILNLDTNMGTLTEKIVKQ